MFSKFRKVQMFERIPKYIFKYDNYAVAMGAARRSRATVRPTQVGSYTGLVGRALA